MGSSSSLVKQLRMVVSGLYDNDKVLENPVGKLGKKRLDSETVEFLKKLVIGLMETQLTSVETKEYLRNEFVSYQEVASLLEKRLGRPFNKSTVQSKVWSDKNRIAMMFKEDLLTKLIEYKDKTGLEEYEEILENSIKGKYSNSYRMISKISLNIKDTTEVVERIPHEDFEELVGILAPYFKKQKEFIENNLPEEGIAYMRYILDNANLDRKQLEDRERLINLISD